MQETIVRAPLPTETDSLAALWHRGWHDAHAAIVPAQLVSIRTLDRFRERVARNLNQMRVCGPAGSPTGLCMVAGDELDQLYVAAEARGAGAASALLRDAEQEMLAAGIEEAWLACAIGNYRAAQFYEKNGWKRAGTRTVELKGAVGGYPLEIWRYEKRLA